ncbi:hypothetical protein [Mesorhizobium sp. KR9-304]|uniref:hypothetical protein n=1 Tax=Mesorhizobium sp. KR9-304 TaxID=3156614 RepID=UPI0032B55075
MRVAIIVPTTAGPALVIRLDPRQNLPLSFVNTAADYQPLTDISERYHDFVGPAGPLRQVFDVGGPQFALTLDRALETGRSWELPVAIAHWFRFHGHEIVREKPDVAIWATGAIQSDLSILPDIYHLKTKLESSRGALALHKANGIPLLVILPNGEESRIIGTQIADLVAPATVSTLREAFDALALFLKPAISGLTIRPSALSTSRFSKARAISKMTPRTAAVLVLVFLGMAIVYLAGSEIGALVAKPQMAANGSAPAVSPGVPTNSPDQFKPVGTSEGAFLTPPDDGIANTETEAGQITLATGMSLVEYRAPKDSSCIEVLFELAVADKTVIEPSNQRFPESESSGLCALAFNHRHGAQVVEVEIEDSFYELVMKSDQVRTFRLHSGQPRMFRLVGRPHKAIHYSFSVKSKSEPYETKYAHSLTQTGE